MYTDISAAQKRIPNLFGYVELTTDFQKRYESYPKLSTLALKQLVNAEQVRKQVVEKEFNECPEPITDGNSLFAVYIDMRLAAEFAYSTANESEKVIWELLLNSLDQSVLELDSNHIAEKELVDLDTRVEKFRGESATPSQEKPSEADALASVFGRLADAIYAALPESDQQ
jgi:hypothetical protein